LEGEVEERRQRVGGMGRGEAWRQETEIFTSKILCFSSRF